MFFSFSGLLVGLLVDPCFSVLICFAPCWYTLRVVDLSVLFCLLPPFVAFFVDLLVSMCWYCSLVVDVVCSSLILLLIFVSPCIYIYTCVCVAPWHSSLICLLIYLLIYLVVYLKMWFTRCWSTCWSACRSLLLLPIPDMLCSLLVYLLVCVLICFAISWHVWFMPVAPVHFLPPCW